MTSPNGTVPKSTGASLKSRVEILEAQLKEAVWYIAELQFALKMIIAQAAMQKLGPMMQQQMQQEIMDRLNAGGIGAGITGNTSPPVDQRPLG